MNNYTVLIGDPVKYSCSDILYPMIGRQLTLDNYQHLKIRIESPHFLELALRGLIGLRFLGANVTYPYKTVVHNYIDEIDPYAKKIGAINTIKVLDEKLVGYNTDGIGAIASIENEGKIINKSDYITIFGAGGSARAIIFELIQKCDNILVINRNFEKLSLLSKELAEITGKNINILELSDFNSNETHAREILENSDFIINTTSLGMKSDVNASILLPELAKKCNMSDCIAFDAIYNPLETTFLKNLHLSGAHTINGVGMLIYQAIESFKLWTGKKVPLDMVKTLKVTLNDYLAKQR